MRLGKSLSLTMLALGMVASTGAIPAQAQTPAAPGVPPSHYGWEYDLEVANRLFENGYLDAAEKDYTKILTAYSDSVPGIDLAWLGLAKVHQARGETPKARASLQEVLSRDTVPGASAEARDRYRQLRAEGEMQLGESQRAVYYFQARYQQTTWMNPFGKLFHWLDYRKAKKSHEKMIDDMGNFDPRYLIEPVAKPSVAASLDAGDTGIDVDGALSGEYRLTPEQMAALLQTNGNATLASATSEETPEDVAGEPPAASATPTVPGVTPAASSAPADLDAVQQEYFAAFQVLREALSSGDQAKIQAATTTYTAAKTAYETAKTQGMSN